MIAREARWGVLLLLLAVAFVAAMGWVLVASGPLPADRLVNLLLPAVALGLGVFVLFAGHVSYPRVQNLRVYLAGYSVGLQSIVLSLLVGFSDFYTDAVPMAPAGYANLVLAFAIVGSFAYSVVRPFPTYRVTRIVTLVAVAIELVVFALIRFFPATFDWFGALLIVDLVGLPAALVAAGGLVVVLTNAVRKPESFYLHGVFSGLSLLAAGSWLLPAGLGALGLGPVSTALSIVLYASVAPLFLSLGMLFHVLARMDHRASYDPLLHVYNRRYCDQILAEQSSVNTRPPIAVLMIDIDHFKKVNDTYGHQAGDQILGAVAGAVQKAVVPDGVVCRYGGEELIVFFPGMSGRDVVPVARRLRETIEKIETPYQKNRISVTISIGLSDRRSPRQGLAQVVYAADKALYLAKDNGRNQLRFVRIKESPQPARSTL